MRKWNTCFTGVTLLVSSAFAAQIQVTSNSDLQQIIDRAKDGDTLFIAAGRYAAKPAAFTEATCGNCQKHQTAVHAARGFLIEGKRLVLRGEGSKSTILVTNAGYGFLLLNSRGTVIENLGITGGRRDTSGAATDAAVVVKYSTATIRNCRLFDNTNRDTTVVVGIGGIMIRENSEAQVESCAITNNAWDGIALYRGASATITDCVIDSGRGAGIGVTWDATAVCLRNRISHYWKGIGSFGTSTVIARNNIVADNLGWGIIASGESSMIAENNTVARNGNCGIAIWNAGTRGRIVNNISAFNGWRKQWVCPCVGFWNQESDTVGWVVKNNLVWGNTAAQVVGMDSTKFLMVNPLFADTLTFQLSERSPARAAGDSTLTNPDGTISDLGSFGGPHAR